MTAPSRPGSQSGLADLSRPLIKRSSLKRGSDVQLLEVSRRYKAAQRLEQAGKVIGGQEVAEMAAHLLVRVNVRASDGCVVEDAFLRSTCLSSRLKPG